jgi:Ca2+-transporting ATPase
VTGKEIDSLGREGLSALLGWSSNNEEGAELEGRGRGVRVFARTTPKHKMRIVEAFKDVGAVVGMTGDGGMCHYVFLLFF